MFKRIYILYRFIRYKMLLKHNPSNYIFCWNCGMACCNTPDNNECGNCGSKDTTKLYKKENKK